MSCGERCCAAMPDPTTVINNNAVPSASPTSLRPSCRSINNSARSYRARRRRSRNRPRR